MRNTMELRFSRVVQKRWHRNAESDLKLVELASNAITTHSRSIIVRDARLFVALTLSCASVEMDEVNLELT